MMKEIYDADVERYKFLIDELGPKLNALIRKTKLSN